MNRVMEKSDWNRWVSDNGVSVGEFTARVGQNIVHNGENVLGIYGDIDEVYKSNLVVPKNNGLEIHTESDVFDIRLIENQDRNMETQFKSNGEGIEYQLNIDPDLEMTPGEKRGVKKGIKDISQISVNNFDLGKFEFVLSSDPSDVSGLCGEFKNGNECWVVPGECASRGYSDYRWRVNRTPHGVMIHEFGHFVEYRLIRSGISTREEIRDIFPPKSDITNYSDKNYRENFAESFRVYVSFRELLNIIDEEKVQFFDQFFSIPERDMKDIYGEYTSIIQTQIQEASTNEHIRNGIEFL